DLFLKEFEMLPLLFGHVLDQLPHLRVILEDGKLPLVNPLCPVFPRVVDADHAGDIPVARRGVFIAGQGAFQLARHLRLHHKRMNVSSASPAAASRLYPAMDIPNSLKAGTPQSTTPRLM